MQLLIKKCSSITKYKHSASICYTKQHARSSVALLTQHSSLLKIAAEARRNSHQKFGDCSSIAVDSARPK